MRVLCVGAGAVGQVYGHHAQQGGATVGVLVRDRHLEEARSGYTLHHLALLGRPKTTHFKPDQIHTLATLGGMSWDVIVLCTSSSALHTSLLGDLAPHVGNATVVVLQPGLQDRALVARVVPDAQVLSGLISLVAYTSPLPGEKLPPGTAVFFPPLNPCLISGAVGRVTPLVTLLDRGGLPTAAHPNVQHAVALPGAILNVLMRVLELYDWRLANLNQPAARTMLTRALAQSVTVACARVGTRPPAVASLLRAPVLATLLRAGNRLAPFPLETYFKAHFSKVADQTILLLQETVEHGRRLGLQVDAVEALLPNAS